ncbi:GNAT family N-acetyltransferase [Luteipulveratus sp. YIM 133132]|uniref:GNAT family N-acetyltransferase n=1 Tax=Luteipulveratus flavus TaxID=3031728 RepID=UPI0023AEBFA0|nr:GNAT family N-acetyltransferase [Luteipulveratus sp. YIM 133132]MDE9364361.1 GNAT family N-acetyltransferase [Luteipulveratus sp. YIM 133132]
MDPDDWPLAHLRLRYDGVELRPVADDDLGELARLLPDDFEHDPRAALLPWLDLAGNRRRLLLQNVWRARGTWSSDSWVLHLVVLRDGRRVGVQTLEADDFPGVATVDTASWLVREVRGRGVGVAMRSAVLGLAFDHLGAVAAVTSAREDNHASLGVSRRVGYTDNGVSLNASGSGRAVLQHLRMTAEQWRASGRGTGVEVSGLEPCRPWFGAATR